MSNKKAQKLQDLHSQYYSNRRRYIPDYLSAPATKTASTNVAFKLDSNIDSSYQPLESREISFASCHDYWIQCLANGLNLLLYGPGSKCSVLNNLKYDLEHRHDISTIKVEAFSPKFSVKHLFIEVLSHYNVQVSPSEKLENLYAYAVDILPSSPRHIFIFLHNLDVLADHQDIISHLASINNIRLVASIDNLYTLMTWAPETRERFNFIYYNVDGFAPYVREKPADIDIFHRKFTKFEMRGFENVLESMTAAQRSILNLLATKQLSDKKMLFLDFFNFCKEETLVSNINQLNDFLTEAIDHKLVKLKVAKNGSKIIHLCIEPFEMINLLEGLNY